MSQERELFIIPRASVDTQYDEHPFYQWLVENENLIETRVPWVVDDYLRGLGFDKEQHLLTGDDVDYLHDLQRAYVEMWVPCRESQALSDLFTPMDGPNTYWLRGTGQVVMTEKLRDLVEPLGVVYPLSPAHYYFEVVGGYLVIKYQHIIGSRRLCPIKEAS